MGFRVWNPKSNPYDRNHLMPIITPTFPSMNSTHNVTHSTMQVLLEEFTVALQKVEKVEEGTATWDEVLEKFDFFHSSKHFLALSIMAKGDQVFRRWLGWIESKLRFLIKQLESMEVVKIRPWPKRYDYKDPEWEFASSLFISLDFSSKDPAKGANGTNGTNGHFGPRLIDFRQCIAEFMNMVNSWGERDKHGDYVNLRLQYLKRSQLPNYVWEAEKQESLKTAELTGTATTAPQNTPCDQAEVHSLSSGDNIPTASNVPSAPLLPEDDSADSTMKKRTFQEVERGSSIEGPPAKLKTHMQPA
eukprot:Blabericola_migrator_1__216@NODE_1057_length_5570_cov_23_138288_g727_i0_p4_GENE_NODE_1057_length_5570_cov_23_138288_g727_i0NODE_1057_length_5570_cov_23_138288_g727_i0_p4_ORF_typecomplete_len303_score49_12PAP_RNAbind/PF04926_15/4e23PAP_central/PF04928_17/2e21_NODE_1057_length_5570_cov_23_138288_g727_i032504158